MRYEQDSCTTPKLSVDSSGEAISKNSPIQMDPYTLHRKRFNGWAQTYDKSFLQWGVFTPTHNLIVKNLREVPSTSRILDLACGTGILTSRLAKMVPNGEVLGLDFSSEMIAQAQAKLPLGKSNITFMEGNAENLPFSDNFFDFVTCSFAFHHFPSPKKALQEILRVLNDGGRFMVIDSYQIFPAGIAIDWALQTFFKKTTSHYSNRGFHSLFRENAFEKIKQKRSFRRLNFFVPALLTMGNANKSE